MYSKQQIKCSPSLHPEPGCSSQSFFAKYYLQMTPELVFQSELSNRQK